MLASKQLHHVDIVVVITNKSDKLLTAYSLHLPFTEELHIIVCSKDLAHAVVSRVEYEAIITVGEVGAHAPKASNLVLVQDCKRWSISFSEFGRLYN